MMLKCDEERNQVVKLPNPSRQEKPLLFCISPYRKPTQVDEERILRPTGEALLRNSAKWPRNFGRRGACRNTGRREMAQATV